MTDKNVAANAALEQARDSLAKLPNPDPARAGATTRREWPPATAH